MRHVSLAALIAILFLAIFVMVYFFSNINNLPTDTTADFRYDLNFPDYNSFLLAANQAISFWCYLRLSLASPATRYRIGPPYLPFPFSWQTRRDTCNGGGAAHPSHISLRYIESSHCLVFTAPPLASPILLPCLALWHFEPWSSICSDGQNMPAIVSEMQDASTASVLKVPPATLSSQSPTLSSVCPISSIPNPATHTYIVHTTRLRSQS